MSVPDWVCAPLSSKVLHSQKFPIQATAEVLQVVMNNMTEDRLTAISGLTKNNFHNGNSNVLVVFSRPLKGG